MRRFTLTITTAMSLSLTSLAQTPNNLISPLGNVGIGTLSPTSKLQVVGNSVFTGAFNLTGNAVLAGTTTISQLKLPALNVPVNLVGMEILIRNPQTGEVTKAGMDVLKDMVYTDMSLPCAGPIGPDGQSIPYNPVWSNGPGKIFVKCPDTVKVGIGTVNPTAKLDVSGIVRSTGLVIGVNPPNAQARLHINYDAPQFASGKILLIENSAGKLLQLDNSGLLRAREIKVDVQAWPDYVFDAAYPLMTPNEIRAFIAAHHHLPGVPSAKEMEENGMDVMTMNAVLLKKIEELTLLLLKQQQQIDALATNGAK